MSAGRYRPLGRERAVRTALPLLAGLGIAVIIVARLLGAAISLLEHRGFALLHQCVPDAGAFGWMGVHLAVVRTSNECPAGTLALGGEPDGVAAVLAAVTLPVLLLHLGGGFAGLGLFSALRRVMTRCSQLGRLLRFATLTTASLPVAPKLQPSQLDSHLAALPRRLALILAPVRRGPPRTCAA